MSVKLKEYQKQYRENNKEKSKIYQKQYREKNKEKLIKQYRKWANQNKSKLSMYWTQYWLKHKKSKKKIQKRYIDSHKDFLREKHKLYVKNNPDKILMSQKRCLEKIGLSVGIIKKNRFKHTLSIWSKVVQKLQNNMCGVCGEKSVLTHHLIHKSVEPKLCLNINNGIALCKKCHYEVHGWGLKSLL